MEKEGASHMLWNKEKDKKGMFHYFLVAESKSFGCRVEKIPKS